MPSHTSSPCTPLVPSFPLPPRPLPPVESLQQSESFVYLNTDNYPIEIEGFMEISKESSVFNSLRDVLSGWSLSTRGPGPVTSPLAWFRRNQKAHRGNHQFQKPSYRSQGVQTEIATCLSHTSLFREVQSPGMESDRIRPHFAYAPKHSSLNKQVSPSFGEYARVSRQPPDVYSPSLRMKRRGQQNKREELTGIFDRNNRARGPFRPSQRSAGKGTPSWQLRQFAEATLGSGSLRKAVKLPEGEDENEWLAVNVVDFYNQINLLYGSITEFCSPTSCPEMKATDEYEYLWQDPSASAFKRPTKMSAPEYVEHLMAWCQANIDNEAVFPAKLGVNFPKQFRPVVQQMFKRLYRVYAHVYCHHYAVVMQLGLEPHLNTSFKHYVLFVDEHGLAGSSEAKKADFWGPLGELVENMLRVD